MWTSISTPSGSPAMCSHAGYPPDLLQEVINTLKEAANTLIAVHQHFGYRTAGEVLGFMRACEGNLSRTQALDHAIFMKVLPKIRGQDTEPMRKALNDSVQWATKRGFLVTANKVRAMAAELRDTGTTRFWR